MSEFEKFQVETGINDDACFFIFYMLNKYVAYNLALCYNIIVEIFYNIAKRLTG